MLTLASRPLDGIVFEDYHVRAAVGVDAEGRKHVLGLCGGASESAEVRVDLLDRLVARSLRADRRRLFVIDAAKALRQAIGRVFGSSNLVKALPEPQGAQRIGSSAEGAARAGAGDVAGGVEARRRRGHAEAGAVCVVAGAGVAVGGVEPARGVVGVVHGQSLGPAGAAAPLPDDDEHHRLVARGGSTAHESGEPLAERGDGGAVGCGDVPGDESTSAASRATSICGC